MEEEPRRPAHTWRSCEQRGSSLRAAASESQPSPLGQVYPSVDDSDTAHLLSFLESCIISTELYGQRESKQKMPRRLLKPELSCRQFLKHNVDVPLPNTQLCF